MFIISFHPDKQGGDPQKFQILQDAYEKVLHAMGGRIPRRRAKKYTNELYHKKYIFHQIL